MRQGARRTGLGWRSSGPQVREARTTTRMQGRLGQHVGLLLLAGGHLCEDGCPRCLGRGEIGSRGVSGVGGERSRGDRGERRLRRFDDELPVTEIEERWVDWEGSQ